MLKSFCPAPEGRIFKMGAERPIFGQRTSPERRRQEGKREKPPNQDIYAAYLSIIPVIERAFPTDREQWRRWSKERRGEQSQNIKELMGRYAKEMKIPQYMRPSIVSQCVRWEGYELLDYEPMEPTLEVILALMTGSAIHNFYLRVLERQIPGAKREFEFINGEDSLSGSVDLLYPHPAFSKYGIIELKSVGSFPFRQIKREGLPDYLRSSPGAYSPQIEHRKQEILYTRSLRKACGLDIDHIIIIYINRDSFERKYSLVPWDSIAEYDGNELIRNIKKAKAEIEKGELPEPSVESKHVCERLCPYRVYCEYGQKFAARQIKKEAKRRPPWVYQEAKRGREELAEKMIKLGISQPRLPDLEG